MPQGRRSIVDKFLDRNDLFGIEFNDGYVFAEVDEFSESEFQPFSNFGTVPSQENLGYTVPEDPDNSDDEILYIQTGKQEVIHCGVGHTPAMLRRYTKYPEGGATMRKHPNLGSPVSANGHKYGYVDGEDSPYDQPTDAEELLIPPGISIAFDFYNPDPTDDHKVKANFKYRVYSIRPLKPSRHKEQIKRIMNPGSPMPVFSAGTADQKVRYRLGDDWGVNAMTEDDIQKLFGGA